MIKFADFLKIKKSYIFATYITKKKYIDSMYMNAVLLRRGVNPLF